MISTHPHGFHSLVEFFFHRQHQQAHLIRSHRKIVGIPLVQPVEQVVRTRSKTAGAKAPTYLVQAMARRPLAELEQERKELHAMVVDTNNRKVMMDSAFESLIKKTTLQKKEATEKVDRFLKTASKKIAVLDAAIQRAGA